MKKANAERSGNMEWKTISASKVGIDYAERKPEEHRSTIQILMCNVFLFLEPLLLYTVN